MAKKIKGGDGASAKIDPKREEQTKEALKMVARGQQQGGDVGNMKARMAARIIEDNIHGQN
jgi:hypothetical protein